MASRGKRKRTRGEVVDYRHKTSSRLNIPPAGLAARGKIVKENRIEYAYNPHLAPSLRFDGTGGADRIAELLDAARHRPLTDDEIKLLQEAFRNYEPWLEWAGKREELTCVADPVALHMHERVSTQAILRVAKREDVQRDLFADPEQEYREAVQFYRHSVDWTNRMILGDSLAVMASLARREALAGKVQMIYMDPPYGIKYASNFQPELKNINVKDRDEDLSRQPEMVKAYRETWTLGVHSYLSYLRDRLLLCRELLSDSGSIFVQISDENLHRVRALLDEVFGAANFVSQITFRTKIPLRASLLPNVGDYVLWYARDVAQMKYRKLFEEQELEDSELFNYAELSTGERLSQTQAIQIEEAPEDGRFASLDLSSSGATTTCMFEFEYQGRKYRPTAGKSWKTNLEGIQRLVKADRLFAPGRALRYVLYHSDYPAAETTNIWMDTLGVGGKVYVVQTNARVIERCMMMTTDAGDLVLDPTCGGGTTATVAEKWGRRWITIDVSRVALAIARQRLLTAKFDYYKLRPTSAEDVQRNPNGPWLTDPACEIQGTCTFDCKTVPHITLKSIAQNQALDPIFEKWAPILDEKLAALNAALKDVPKETRQKLALKLVQKQQTEGKRAITEGDRRRWNLPGGTTSTPSDNGRGGTRPSTGWEHWTAPFDTDPDWPEVLQQALTDYRQAWRGKMDEVNECIAARAGQEELVNQPEIDRGKVRVSGPFTMEGIIPAEESILGDEDPHPSPLPVGEGAGVGGPLPAGEGESPIGGAPESLETFGGTGSTPSPDAVEGVPPESEQPIETDSQNAEAYLDRMIRLLRQDGVRFPDNKVVKFTTMEALVDGSILHADGAWEADGEDRRVAVMFGPQYGALNALMVEDAIGRARRGGYDDLVFAAFSFDGAAQALIQEDPDPKLRIHMAQIRPDVNMGDLLKTTVSSQIFTVSGMPRTELREVEADNYIVEMQGVDIYDPVTNAVRSAGAQKVAAWFLDSDYDGRCFCITQAFFPDKQAWSKLGKALSGTLDDAAFEKFSGTVSLPFPAGTHKRVAVKVIDPRGNEVMRVHRIGGTTYDK